MVGMRGKEGRKEERRKRKTVRRLPSKHFPVRSAGYLLIGPAFRH